MSGSQNPIEVGIYDAKQLTKALDLQSTPSKVLSSAVGGLASNDGRSLRIPPDPMRVCGPGERNSHLVRLVGRWIGVGLSVEEVVTLARMTNAHFNPSLGDDEVVRTCESVMRTHRRNHPLTESEPIAPLFSLDEARVSRFIRTDPPPRRWLLESLVPLGKVAALVGAGGSSKSFLMLQIAVGVAAGVPVASAWTPGVTGGVLVLAAEDDDEELHRRLHRISSAVAVAHPEVFDRLESNLFVKSLVGANNLLTATTRTGEVESTALVGKIVQAAREVSNLRLIILDPASRFRGGQENSNEDATRFVEALESISQSLDVNVFIAHHVNKMSSSAEESHQGASRGASAFTDGVRCQLNIMALSKSARGALKIVYPDLPDDEIRRYFTLDLTKSNYGPPQAPTVLYRGDGGYLEARILPDPKQHVAEQELANVIRAIEALPTPMTARSFSDRYGGAKGCLGMGALKVRATIEEGRRRGYLTDQDRKPVELTSAGRAFLADRDEGTTEQRIHPRHRESTQKTVDKSAK